MLYRLLQLEVKALRHSQSTVLSPLQTFFCDTIVSSFCSIGVPQGLKEGGALLMMLLTEKVQVFVAPSNTYEITDDAVSIANKHILIRGVRTASPYALYCLCAYFPVRGYHLKGEERKESMHITTVLELLQSSFLVVFLRDRKLVVGEIGLFMFDVNSRKFRESNQDCP